MNNQEITVAVAMWAYNHEKYISQAIESVLMQKTNFPFKIFLGEDFSTDKTREICLNLRNNNPDKIELLLNEKNLGPNLNSLQVLTQCYNSNAKYIAFLDGDDYWTDPYKLQKQVDFLEANPDFAICFHNIRMVFEGLKGKNRLSNRLQKGITDVSDLAKGNYIYTASCIFRNKLLDCFPEWFYTSPIGDYPLHMLNAEHGKIKFINQVMAVYRIHQGGGWGKTSAANRIEKTTIVLEYLIEHFKNNAKVKNNLIEKYVYFCLQLVSYYINIDDSKSQNFLNKIKPYKIWYKKLPYYAYLLKKALKSVGF